MPHGAAARAAGGVASLNSLLLTTLPLILRLGRVTGDVVQVSPLSTLQPDALVLQVLSLLALLVLSLLALLLNTAA